MNNKILVAVIFVLACEFLFFHSVNCIECEFMLGLVICWLLWDYILSFFRNDFFKGGYYQEYHTSYNQYSNNSEPYNKPYPTTKTYNDFSYTPTQSKDDVASKLVRAIKPNMHIVVSNDEKVQKDVNDKKKAYAKMLTDKKVKITFDKPTVKKKENNKKDNNKDTNKPTLLLPTKVESAQIETLNTSKETVTISSSLIVIDNVPTLSDIKKNVYDATINYFKSKSLSIIAIRDLLKNFAYVDVIESSDGKSANVIFYINDFNLLKTHDLTFSDLVKNIKEKCKSVKNVSFKKILQKDLLGYYDSFSNL